MKVNRVRRGFEITAGVLGEILGVLEFVFGLITVIASRVLIGILIFSIIDMLLGITLIIVSAFLFSAPTLGEDNKPKTKKGIIVTLIVFISLLMIACIINIILLYINILGIILFIICLVTLAFLITCLCLPVTVKEIKNADTNSATTEMNSSDAELFQKMKELKKLKELYVISEDQYFESLEKLLKEYKKPF